jgi:hypothetical protein
MVDDEPTLEDPAGTLNNVMGKAVVNTVQAIPHDPLCLEHALEIGA